MEKRTVDSLTIEWDGAKNGAPLHQKTIKNSKYWWRCSKGHSFQQPLGKRLLGSNCPYCSGRSLLEGFNDLKTCFPKVAAHWDHERNTIGPHQVFGKSNKKFYFKCHKNHLNHAIISNLTRNTDYHCPKCLQQKIELHQIQKLDERIVKEYSHNNKRNIEYYSRGSSIKLEWECSLKHSWMAPIKDRYRGRNCPYCANILVGGDYNSLALMEPILASEYSSKNKLKAHEIYYKSSKNAVWNCFNCFREYETPVRKRTINNLGCPNCSPTKPRSKPEKELLLYIKNIYGGEVVANDRRILLGKELDIYLPELGMAIEFNGDYWHGINFKKNISSEEIVEKHLYKRVECSKQSIDLFFVWESDWKNNRLLVLEAVSNRINRGLSHPILEKLING